MTCKNCKYYLHNGHFGACRRYPKTETKSENDWCGEFAHLETFTLPVFEMKKRGRPAKENK